MMRLVCLKAQVKFNIRMRLARITSAQNILADALSRNDRITYAAALEEWRAGRNQPPDPPPWDQLVAVTKGCLLHRAEEAVAKGYGP